MGDARPGAARFTRIQRDYFDGADERKFRWQTTDPYLAATERALLERTNIGGTDRLLEVGCGEGGNLKLLTGAAKRTVGVDLWPAKARWARREVASGTFACADACRLPFRNESFDVVLCRDVLHHVLDKQQVLAEMFRVCRMSGRLIVIEPNGRNPIMWLLGLAVGAERHIIENSPNRLLLMFSMKGLEVDRILFAQPFPVGRMIFHYRWGVPRLSSLLAGVVRGLEDLIGCIVPTDRWAYMIMTAAKRAPAGPTSAGAL